MSGARTNCPVVVYFYGGGWQGGRAGTADTDVDPSNSDRFAEVLSAHHNSVELKKYPGYGHDALVQSFSTVQRAASPVLADIGDFIHAH
jgi:acetyl esterase/lipase